MLLSRKRGFSIIYTVVTAIAVIFLLITSVRAYTLTDFSYESHYYMESGYTSSMIKSDSSNAMVYYTDGPGSQNLNVQLWGSDCTSADTYNFTTGGTIAAKSGNLVPIPNTAYQYYNGGRFYVRLKMWVYGAGTVSGKWSPTTK